jgi:hypothetical protein
LIDLLHHAQYDLRGLIAPQEDDDNLRFSDAYQQTWRAWLWRRTCSTWRSCLPLNLLLLLLQLPQTPGMNIDGDGQHQQDDPAAVAMTLLTDPNKLSIQFIRVTALVSAIKTDGRNNTQSVGIWIWPGRPVRHSIPSAPQRCG